MVYVFSNADTAFFLLCTRGLATSLPFRPFVIDDDRAEGRTSAQREREEGRKRGIRVLFPPVTLWACCAFDAD